VTDYAGYTIQPALDLSQEFGANHPVDITKKAKTAGEDSVWIWEYGFAQKNPDLVKQIVATMKGTVITPSPASTPIGVYQIKWGENLSLIAAGYGLSWQVLWAMNRSTIVDPDKVYAGQWIRVPSK
jgi:nucleoid-associated protein YgaU